MTYLTDQLKKKQETLESEQRFREIIENAPYGICVTGLDTRFLHVNEPLCKMLGYSAEELVKTPWTALTHPDDLGRSLQGRERLMREPGRCLELEKRFLHHSGTVVWVRMRITLQRDRDGNPLYFVVYMEDITERIKTDQTRQFELSLIQSIHAETLEGILVVNQAGIVVSHNKRFLDIWALDDSAAQSAVSNSYIGLDDRTLLSSVLECVEDPQPLLRRIQELYEHPDEEDHCEIALKDGRVLERHSAGLKNPEGKYLGRVWFFRDITALKEAGVNLQNAKDLADDANCHLPAERSILETERGMLRGLIDSIPDLVFVKDVKSRFIMVNSRLAQTVGALTPEELLGKTDSDIFPAAIAGAIYKDDRNVMDSGQPLHNREETIVDSAGNEIHLLTTKVPLRDDKGRVTGIAGIGRDISARKEMEDALRDAEQKYRGIFDNAIFGIFQSTPDGRVLSVNSALALIYGYGSAEEVMGLVSDISHQVYADPKRREDFMRLMEENQVVQNFEYESYRKDGSKIWLSMTARAIREKGVVVRYEGMTEDITERKKMEDALREAERNYRGIFDKAIVGIFQSTPDGSLLSVNPAMAFTFGYDSPEEMIATVTDISRQFFVNPKRGVDFMLVMDRVGGVKNFECEVFCKDGSKVWLSLSIRAIRENGAVARYEGMCQEISERKHLQEQLLQAQKLESVGQLAAGIAHEINTPTQYIGDNVRFLKDAFQDIQGLVKKFERLSLAVKGNALGPKTIQETATTEEIANSEYLLEEIPKAIEQTLEGVTRVSTLVSAMREFSHPGSKEKTPQDLNRAIGSTITVSRNEWKYVAEMETDFDPALPLIPCLPGEFNQVILNLIVNAAHAIEDVVRKGGPEKGTIKVQTRSFPEWAEVRIQDSGTGIPHKVRTRVFDPFFTTKAVGKGTGQGLAIARSVIVDKHGGSIQFETEEGKGTTFIIRLPRNGNFLLERLWWSETYIVRRR